MTHIGRLLIVDGDVERTESVVHAARVAGHLVTAAGGTAEALSLAENRGFDVALLGHLPSAGFNGIELGQQLRRLLPHIGLVLMIHPGDERLPIMALRAGFDDCLVHPFGAGELTSSITAAIEAARRRTAVEEELAALRESQPQPPAAVRSTGEVEHMLNGASAVAASLVHDLRKLMSDCNQTVAAILRAEDAQAQSRVALEFLVRHTRALDLVRRRMEALSQTRGRRRTVVSLNTIVEEVAEALRALTGAVRVEVRKTSSTPRVFGDRQRLIQALACLLANALEAIGPAAEKTIVLEVGDEGEWGTIAVRDSGLGVRLGREEKIFEPFYSAWPEGEHAGLGLFCARRIAEEHGGTLELASGDDATFVLRLPKLAPRQRRGEG